MNDKYRFGTNICPREAIRLQRKLAGKIRQTTVKKHIELIAGIDCGINKDKNLIAAGVIVFSFPNLEEVERRFAIQKLTFPYVPGLLSFRECPAVLKAFSKLKNKPDVIFFDGHGVSHPRKFGIASHAGFVLDLPSIGCAKSLLVGKYKMPKLLKGKTSDLIYKDELVGKVLVTRDGCKPIFVSIGHKITLKEAVSLTKRCLDKTRIPKPTREADKWVKALAKKA
jgi:deoxyribonuclease V